ncbi:MAG TPA: alpha/beta hydrolase-fold protein [Aggregatilineaceae bacterium]|nr:alpha/beta hydrolase-fold protein [Aggregatilineaceae bacterium]
MDHRLSSVYVNQEYHLFVSLPLHYTHTNQRYPVLYLLDGNLTTPLIVSIVELLRRDQAIPELIVVGIGYPEPTYAETQIHRARDYTPTPITPGFEMFGHPYQETGGGERFLQFIERELLPTIDATYRTDPTDRALAGWSLGGLFALYAMLQRPTLFQRILAISPSLMWGNRVLFQIESEYAAAHTELPLRLFVGRESEPGYESYVEETRGLVETLKQRQYAGLDVNFHLFEDENHLSVVPLAYTRGLRLIYE